MSTHTITNTNCLDSVNYKGQVTGYGEVQGGKHYMMQHRMDVIQRKLTDFIEPYVECGFGAEQIKQELEYQGETLVSLGQINAIIKKLLGAMA